MQTVTRMPIFSVDMGQSAGVYNGDSMFVVAGTYTAAAGQPATKYTASTDAWAYGTFCVCVCLLSSAFSVWSVSVTPAGRMRLQ